MNNKAKASSLSDLKSIRRQHKMQVFSLLQKQDYTCKALSQELNISTVSLYRVLEELVQHELLSSVTPDNIELGRKPLMYSLNNAFGYFIVFDFILPITKVAVYDLSKNLLCYQEYKQNPPFQALSKKQLMDIIEKTKKTVEDLNISDKIRGVGASVAGRINQKSGFFVASAMFEEAQTINLKQLLTENFHCPAFVKNNISLALIDFISDFTPYKIKNAFYLYINNGNIGSSILIKHQNHNGDNFFAGEIASALLPDKRALYSCIRLPEDCVYEQLGICPTDENAVVEFMQAYDEGNPIAEAWVHERMKLLAVFMFNFLLILDCNTVIIDCFFISPSKKAQDVFQEMFFELFEISTPPKLLFRQSSNSIFLNGGLSYTIQKTIEYIME